MDQSNRRLDRTHTFKFSTIYNLPFGKGQKWLTRGFLSQAIGGWRPAGIQQHDRGAPIALTRNNPLPIFNDVTRPVDGFADWRPPLVGDRFDPAKDRFLKPANQFPVQPIGFGNATRYNPKVRGFLGQVGKPQLAARHSIYSTASCSARAAPA